jgi:hypothetical protein
MRVQMPDQLCILIEVYFVASGIHSLYRYGARTHMRAHQGQFE